VFRQIIDAEMQVISFDILKDFRKTTETWEHEPQFDRLIQVGPASVEILVGTDDKIYRYVDEGTKPHLIPKGRPGLLAFPSGYVAKTTVNVIGSKAGGSYGDTVFVHGQVHHPGTKARNFDKLIQKKWGPLYKKRMEAAMRKATKASGHAI